MSPTSVRHPAKIAARAVEHREAGWPVSQIRVLLNQEFGVKPSADSIKRWTGVTYAAKSRERMAKRHLSDWQGRWQFRLAGPQHTPEYAGAFVRRLRAEGVPVATIARVCRVVLGGQWNERKVRQCL